MILPRTWCSLPLALACLLPSCGGDVGDSCGDGLDCNDGLFCLVAESGEEGTCAQPPAECALPLSCECDVCPTGVGVCADGPDIGVVAVCPD